MDDQQEGTAPVSPAVPERVQEIAKDELERTKQPMQKVEIQSLNTRAYLDHTVVPILMDAMTAVAKDRYRATPNEALVQPCKHARIRITPWRFSLLFSSDLQTLSSLLPPFFCRTRRSISSTDTAPQIDKFFPYLLRGHTHTHTRGYGHELFLCFIPLPHYCHESSVPVQHLVQQRTCMHVSRVIGCQQDQLKTSTLYNFKQNTCSIGQVCMCAGTLGHRALPALGV